MYHGITAPHAPAPPEREMGAELYDVSAEQFRAQLAWLRDRHYRTITIQKNLDVFSTKEILLTFDDGEMSNCTIALPLLMDVGFTGHFFLIAKRIGKEGYMGWKEIRQLHEAGMVIGSHGFSHEILTSLLDSQIEEELSASKKYLERNLGIQVESLSIPRGFCNDKILRMAKEAGYTSIFLSETPTAPQPGCFSRIAVKSNWTLERFTGALEGKTSWSERMREACKNSAKKFLGGTFYDWLRKMLLKVK